MKIKTLSFLSLALMMSACTPSNGDKGGSLPPNPVVTPDGYQTAIDELLKGFSYESITYNRGNLKEENTVSGKVDFINKRAILNDYWENTSYYDHDNIIAVRKSGAIHKRGGDGFDDSWEWEKENVFNFPEFDLLTYDEESKTYIYTAEAWPLLRYYYTFDNDHVTSIKRVNNSEENYTLYTFTNTGVTTIEFPAEVQNYEFTLDFGSEDDYLTIEEAIAAGEELKKMTSNNTNFESANPGYRWYTKNAFDSWYVKGPVTKINQGSSSLVWAFLSNDPNNKFNDDKNGILLNGIGRKSDDKAVFYEGDVVYVNGYMAVDTSFTTGSYAFPVRYGSSDSINEDYYWNIVKVDYASVTVHLEGCEASNINLDLNNVKHNDSLAFKVEIPGRKVRSVTINNVRAATTDNVNFTYEVKGENELNIVVDSYDENDEESLYLDFSQFAVTKTYGESSFLEEQDYKVDWYQCYVSKDATLNRNVLNMRYYSNSDRQCGTFGYNEYLGGNHVSFKAKSLGKNSSQLGFSSETGHGMYDQDTEKFKKVMITTEWVNYDIELKCSSRNFGIRCFGEYAVAITDLRVYYKNS